MSPKKSADTMGQLDRDTFVARVRNRSNLFKNSRKERKKQRAALVKSLLVSSEPTKNIPAPKKDKSFDIVLTPSQKEYYIKLLKQRKNDVIKNQVKLLLEISFPLGENIVDTSITLDDARSLIVFLQLQHHMMGGPPTWVKLENSKNLVFSVVLVVEDIGLREWEDAEDCPSLKSAQYHVPMYSPCTYGADIISDLVTTPLSLTQLKVLQRKYATYEEASSSRESSQKLLCTMFKMEKTVPAEKRVLETESVSHWKQDKFPRTMLLLTPWQMIQNNYPLPVDDNPYNDFVNLKEKYKQATDQSPMFGLDCEMCQTTQGSELTRVSVVNENHEIVYERLVKPYNRITNYLTRYSGITCGMLTNVDTRLEQVQSELSNLLPPDAILIGQSLNSDLQALKMMHPYVIDTSVIFNMSGDKNRKTGLRVLCQEFLSERIQQGGSLGHDSIEDAIAAIKLVQAKLQKYFEWGNAILDGPRDSEEEKTAHLLLEQNDNADRPAFIRKYAKVSICDETPPFRKSKKKSLPAAKNTGRIDTGEHRVETIDAASVIEHLTRCHNKLVLIGKDAVMEEYASMTPPGMRAVTIEEAYQQEENENNSRKVIYSEVSSNKAVVEKMCEVAKYPTNHRTTVWGHVRMRKPNIRRVSKWLKKLKENFPTGKSVITLILTGSKTSKGLCVIDTNSLRLKTNEELMHEAIATCKSDYNKTKNFVSVEYD